MTKTTTMMMTITITIGKILTPLLMTTMNEETATMMITMTMKSENDANLCQLATHQS
jgi:hypothetical protein